MAKKKRRTLASVTLERAGVRNGSRVLAFIMQWWIVHHELGRAPTVPEYGEWWKMSQATAYRERQAFQDAWPEFRDPSVVALVLGIDLVEGTVPSLLAVDVEGLEA